MVSLSDYQISAWETGNSRKRKWRVKNTTTRARVRNHSCENDGDADSFGVGDFCFLRYYGGTEIDDCVISVGVTPEQCKAHQDNFLTGENVENKDVVIWYAANFTHIMYTKKWAILLSPP